jgi:hypothetical protein
MQVKGTKRADTESVDQSHAPLDVKSFQCVAAACACI